MLSLLQEGPIQGAQLQGCQLQLPSGPQLRWQHSQLLDCTAQGGDLGHLESCTLRGAKLKGLRIHSLRDCDLSHAVLSDVDLRGADLRGACFFGATLSGCPMDEAQVAGADLREVSGLSPTVRAALLSAGAFEQASWRSRAPQWLQGRRGDALLALGAGLACLSLVALSLPTAPEKASVASLAEWVPEQNAAERTQDHLQDFRAGIAAAHLKLKGRGGRTYPTLEEVQANHYDLDGDGPSLALGVLFPKGMPRNLLSQSEGSVLPYCNAVPDQLTLSEEDVDWHYCPETGRVLASAGHTQEPTLSW